MKKEEKRAFYNAIKDGLERRYPAIIDGELTVDMLEAKPGHTIILRTRNNQSVGYSNEGLYLTKVDNPMESYYADPFVPGIPFVTIKGVPDGKYRINSLHLPVRNYRFGVSGDVASFATPDYDYLYNITGDGEITNIYYNG